jgi:hypothetical protein
MIGEYRRQPQWKDALKEVEDCSSQTVEDVDDFENGEQTWENFAAWFKLKINLTGKKKIFAERYVL